MATVVTDADFEGLPPATEPPAPAPANVKRTRRRRSPLAEADKPKIVDRIVTFYRDDLTNRRDESDARLQRIAKLRMWTEGKQYPWPDASDIGLSDLMTHSLRIQDTLANAVLSAEPAIISKATNRSDRKKQDDVDQLLHHQFFIEANGEQKIGDAAFNFVNDGVVTFFIPWVNERRESLETSEHAPIPEDMLPTEYFQSILSLKFSASNAVPTPDGEGWDWLVQSGGDGDEDEEVFVQFYTRRRGAVEMVSRRMIEAYDGPSPRVVDWDDILTPPRVANLQIPTPSNPGGSPHVIMRDFPTIDEIKRLAKSKFYKLTQDELDSLNTFQRGGTDEEQKKQADTLQGVVDNQPKTEAADHRTVTRLMCFDLYDIDNDGVAEDVIWWVLVEPKLLVRQRRLSEVYPATPPRRPFAEQPFFPVPGRRVGMSLLELMEGLHDAMKISLDQTVDGATMTITPPGWYRSSSAMSPEVMTYSPGELYGVSDPQRDINFPQLPNDTSIGINLYTLMQSMEERLTMTGDFQFGRVPAGRSAALRTVGGMQLLAGQGEARPERLLRRFFTALTELWHQMHELNQAFLKPGKQILVVGLLDEKADPYRDIKDLAAVRGRFIFDFKANAFNSSKVAMQEALQAIGELIFNELAFTIGTAGPDGYYRWQRDVAVAWGQDPDRYLASPPPEMLLDKITARDAVQSIRRGQLPNGVPLEGALPHLEKLQEFAQSDAFGFFNEAQVKMFFEYTQEVQQRAVLEQQRKQLAASAAPAAGGGNGQPGRPAENPPPDLSPPPVQGAELLDETLPSAGGGAAGAV